VHSKICELWIVRGQGGKIGSETRFTYMKRYICLLAGMAVLAACEQRQTTVNPPAEKKESNTTVVNPPAEKKESQTTVINPSPATETKKEKTEININTSPSPH
jgi:hypothetical protein